MHVQEIVIAIEDALFLDDDMTKCNQHQTVALYINGDRNIVSGIYLIKEEEGSGLRLGFETTDNVNISYIVCNGYELVNSNDVPYKCKIMSH